MKKMISILLAMTMLLCFMPMVTYAAAIDISQDGAVEINVTDQVPVYTGSELKPTVIVSCGGIILKATSDYAISYSNNVNVGTAKITITGDGTNFVGTTTSSFQILPKSIATISEGQIATQIVSKTITESAIKIKDGVKPLVPGNDFEITSPAAVVVSQGSNVLTISGKGNYTGTQTLRFMGGIDIKDFKLSWNAQTFTYNGNYQTPSGITLRDLSNSAISSNYYTVICRDNKDAGEAKIIIEGNTNYAGTTYASFTIKPKTLTKTMIQSIANAISGNDPEIIVKDGSATLEKNKDYFVTFARTSSGGTATIEGTGNYTGTTSAIYKTGASLEDANVKLQTESYTYDGTAKTPNVAVWFSNYVLKQNTDYRLEYKDNTNAGTATVSIIGIGSYAGKIIKDFTISRLDLSNCSMSISPMSAAYTGNEIKPIVTLTYGGRNLSSYDYEVRYTNNIYVGTGTVFVYSKGNTLTGTRNTSGSLSKQFTIGGTSIASAYAYLSPTSYLYDGKAKEPAVTVMNGTKKLVNGTDYTVTYSNNKAAGTATVTITGKGMYSGTQTLNFTISGKAQTVTTNYTKYSRYLTSDPFQLGAKATGDGTGFTYTSSDPSVAKVTNNGIVVIEGTGIATITVATSGTSAYNPATKTVTVTVKPLKATPKLYSTAKGKLKVRVTKGIGVTKYQIRYGKAGSYKYTYITPTDNGYATQSKTIKGLRSGSKYYVKIRPYKLASDGVTKVWGNWSSVKSIRIK